MLICVERYKNTGIEWSCDKITHAYTWSELHQAWDVALPFKIDMQHIKKETLWHGVSLF